MRSLKITAAILAAVALVCVPSVASAAPVSSSFAAARIAAAPPGFDPSSSKWRAWMLNVTGSVLGNAMPSSWKAEMIANQFALRMSPDALAAATGIGAGSPLDRIPETIEDYKGQEFDRMYKRKLTATGTGPVRAPATPAKAFVKTVGGVGAALTALEVGTFLGGMGANVVGDWFGFDANGLVCANSAGTPGEMLTSWVTGQDCDAFKLATAYQPNNDAEQSISLSFQGTTLAFAGRKPNAGTTVDYFCYSGVTGQWQLPADKAFWIKNHAGNYASLGGRLTAISSSTVRTWTCNVGLVGLAAYKPETSNAAGAASDPSLIWIGNVTGFTPETADAKPTVTAGDPDRQQECKVTYTDGTSKSSLGPLYKESQGGVVPCSPPATPSGKVPENVTVTETQPGTGTAPKELYSEDTTQGFQDWQTQFPECGDGTCFLDLVKITPGAVVSCFDLTDGCPGWFEDPAKTDTYKCLYGAEEVPLGECNAYAGLFTPQRVEVGSPYSDPVTGTWSGGQTAPKSGQTAMAKTVQNPEQLRSCDFSGLGFDPVGWVLRPIQCGMEWAFAPRPTVVELGFAQSVDAWEGKPPAVLADTVSALSPSASGCSRGVELFDTSFNVIDACSGIGADIAFWSRMVTSAGMVILVLVLLRRQIAAMVNYNQGQG